MADVTYGTFIEAYGDFSKELSFLARATPRQFIIDRPYLGRIKIEPSDVEKGKFKGVATNGKRLHIVDPLSTSGVDRLEAGMWRPLKMGGQTSWIARIEESGDRYIPYRSAIPAEETAEFVFRLEGVPRIIKSPPHDSLRTSSPYYHSILSLVMFLRQLPDPTAINLNYLNALNPDLIWTVYWYAPDKPVLFRSGTYTAVIMPMLGGTR
jgi:hypothetical protein